MSDPTEEQLKEAARRALADGNTESAQRLIAAARQAGAVQAQGTPAQSEAMTEGLQTLSNLSNGIGNPEMPPNPRAGEVERRLPPERTLGYKIADNLIGIDDGVMSPGEKLGEAVNMAGRGLLLRGMSNETAGRIDEFLGRGDAQERADFYNRNEAQFKDENPVLAVGSEIAGGILLPGGAVTKGAGWLANTAKAMAVGGLYGGTYAYNTSESDNTATDTAVGVAAGMAGGALAVPASKVIGWAGRKFGNVAQRIMRQRRYFDGNRLTAEGQEAIKAAGIDPETLTREFNETFAREAAQASSPVEGARVAQMAEFGIPANRANATGSVDDFATLERARRGGMGVAAENRVTPILDAQMGAARRAGDDIATGLSGGNTADQFDAAVSAQQGLREAQRVSRTRAGDAYTALEEAGGGIQGANAVNMGQRLQNSLRVEGINLSEIRTPNAMSALEDLDFVFKDAAAGSVPFMDVERARQNLVRLRSAANRGSNGADQRAMSRVMETFDAQVDNLMHTAMTEGDAATLDLARNARGLWREYSETFTGDGAASRFIQKMTDEDASPDDVARWLFSSGKLGSGQFNSNLAGGIRDAMGADSEAWSAIRQGAFRQLVQKPDGMTPMGPQKMSENILGFFNAPTTRQLSREMFSAEERALMIRYAGALKQMVPPAGAVNYSNTSYEGSRMVQQAARGVASALGFATSGGNPLAAVGASSAVAAGQGVAARSAVSGVLNPRGAASAIRRPIAPAATGAVALEGQANDLLGYRQR